MNEKFFTLSPEKQARITNAALEVFARNDYKHASTDDIAAKAGISKGLLFYYFRNKQSLYLYLYDYALEQVRGQVAVLERQEEAEKEEEQEAEYGALQSAE